MITVAPEVVRPKVALAALARTVSVGLLAGALSGAVIGGVLGRLAMRLLAVTSPETVGLVTDDDAIVGEISLVGTLGLIYFTGALGAAGGLGYLLARRILPAEPRRRVVWFAAFTGLVGGALVVHGYPAFDFTVLHPGWLAVAMFVAIPTSFGAVCAAAIEFADRPGGPGGRWPLPVLLIASLAVLVGAPPVAAVAAPFLAGAVLVTLLPTLGRAWRSRAVSILGAILFAGLALWGLADIAADIVSMAAQRPIDSPFSP